MDTLGTWKSVLYREVSSFQGCPLISGSTVILSEQRSTLNALMRSVYKMDLFLHGAATLVILVFKSLCYSRDCANPCTYMYL